MKLPPRQKFYLVLAITIFVTHLLVAAIAKPSFALTVYGDANPCALLIIGVLASRVNSRQSPGILPVFWKLFAVGLAVMFFSQAFWFYFDWRRLNSSPSPIPGDTLFLLAHAFFLSALALRPHSASAGHNLRIRLLDLVLLSLWWLSLYGYLSLPWLVGRLDFSHYNPSYYTLAFVQHLAIILALAVLCFRNSGLWRSFYLQLLAAFVFIAAGNLLLSVAIDSGKYYAGSFYDTPFLLAILLFTPIAGLGSALQPRPDSRPNRELLQSVWTARLAMFCVLSLPAIAFLGLFHKGLPYEVVLFRLRLVFGAMLLLCALLYCKFNLLARELHNLVRLTRDSIENLNAVQRQVTHSEKLAALGRLAAGAAHEISNPLTAIFGYSELLTDIASLTPEDRANAQSIQQQVHRAQAAVNSLRNSVRHTPSTSSLTVDKNPAS